MALPTPRILLWSVALIVPAAAHASCEGLLPVARHGPAHAVRPEDVARLRDIGMSEVLTSEPSPLAISPDGRQVAFVLSQADPATDGYCRGVVVVDIAGVRPPRLVDRGGTLVTAVDPYRGHLVPDGIERTITPIWSPDGRRIAYLRRDAGATQLWVSDADGHAGRPLTQSAVNIETFAWAADGESLIFSSKPGLAVAAAAIDAASRTGWLYDAAMSPDYGPRPQLPADVPSIAQVVSLATRATRTATADEAARLSRAGNLLARLGEGRLARVAPIDARPFAATRITVGGGTGGAVCAAEPCTTGVFAMLWDAGRSELLFLRREGFNKETTALYGWSPTAGANPRRILATGDAVLGCTIASVRLLCLAENATTPRHLVAIDPQRGTIRKVFEPNPEVAAWQLGHVDRLRFTNRYGLPAWGDFVLPPSFRRGQPVPMVVVQYHSTGFLRGGTGNEYPIYALAARGMAVLSFERPGFYAQSLPGLATWDAVTAANGKDWAERRSILSSIEEGVKRAVATGAINSARIGITGLSDGSSTARFALINAPGLFRAAAISTCCVEMRTTMTYGGIAWADSLRALGYPPATDENEDFWRPYSMALNADRMTTPLLMQLADNEYLLSLETVTALREHHQPFEMYVFPDEFHFKWHSAHRLSIYRRNIDWFAYWLLGETDPELAKAAQYRRWDALRRSPSDPAAARP